MPAPMRFLTPLATLFVAAVVALSSSCIDEHKPNPVDTSGTLPVPPAGQGTQFGTPEITIAPGDEIQNCYFFKVKDILASGGMDATSTLNLHRIQVSQTKGSHHMNLFRVRTVVPPNPMDPNVGLDPTKGTSYGKNGQGPCFKSSNWADWPLVANTQQEGELDWTYPDGVANKLSPDEWIMLQTHYVNATTQNTPSGIGKVAVNFWHMQPGDIQNEMGTLFATNQSIRICQSNPTPTYQASCHIQSDGPVHVVGANGHFHSRGKTFSIYSWDGSSTDTPPEANKFYVSNDWNEPPMAHSPALDVTIPANGGIVYTCEYQWQPPEPQIGCDGLNAYDAMKNKTPPTDLDCCYAFGGIVEKNEHCNAFVYYYPKSDNVTCF